MRLEAVQVDGHSDHSTFLVGKWHPATSTGHAVDPSSPEFGKRILVKNRLREYCSVRKIDSSSKSLHTAVTFLTLRAVMPRSPPCLASIAASLMSLEQS